MSRGQTITGQLKEGMERLARRSGARRFIAYFQSFSNTYAPVAKLRALYREALAFPEVVGLSIGTRPDCLTPEVLDLLADIARDRLLWLELGLQSAHDETLKRLNRGHDVACFTEAVRAAADRGLEVVAHVILGLPGEGRREMTATARYLGSLPLQGVKIHLLYVVKGSALEDLYRSGGYRPLEAGEYVSLVADFLALLPPHLIIHRLTGDPHPDELVAPAWCRDKSRVLTGIKEEMARRGSRQGSAWEDQPCCYPPVGCPTPPL
jgi:radical SAM protein (TIGR01212 family)